MVNIDEQTNKTKSKQKKSIKTRYIVIRKEGTKKPKKLPVSWSWAFALGPGQVVEVNGKACMFFASEATVMVMVMLWLRIE